MAKFAIVFLSVITVQAVSSFNPLALLNTNANANPGGAANKISNVNANAGPMIPTEYRVPMSTHVISFRRKNISLKGVCQDIMMHGTADMLPDAMRDIAVYLKADPTRYANAGGDPNLNCLFQYGMRGGRDVGNFVSDYFDTIIEWYPRFILNPCENIQCRGEENPLALANQAYLSWMNQNRRMMGGRRGMMTGNMGMGGVMPGIAGRGGQLQTGTIGGQNIAGATGGQLLPGTIPGSNPIPPVNTAFPQKPPTGNFGSLPPLIPKATVNTPPVNPAMKPSNQPPQNVVPNPTANVPGPNPGAPKQPTQFKGNPFGFDINSLLNMGAPQQGNANQNPLAGILNNPQIMQMMQQMMQQLFSNFMAPPQANAGQLGQFGMPNMAQLLQG